LETFSALKAIKKQNANRFFKVNHLETSPKKAKRSTNLKQGQIYEIWPKKGQLGNPVSQQRKTHQAKIVDALKG